jgi:hypothetical protein
VTVGVLEAGEDVLDIPEITVPGIFIRVPCAITRTISGQMQTQVYTYNTHKDILDAFSETPNMTGAFQLYLKNILMTGLYIILGKTLQDLTNYLGSRLMEG